MDVINIKLVEKLKRKNKGNASLITAIDRLISDFKSNTFLNQEELNRLRPDADCVHSDGFYFFNINIHRILVLIEFDEQGEITIVWCGTHAEYENTFKNNKDTIRKWLRDREWIN
ncbi:type II toxin-antitoxin system HigB family toxin [Flavobacterium sp. RHBU_24]|uniref:type II toxin-antitoxin system HigB family toxin n=1 Tax=Flavobacterium sp. RHBU_24 TaxID=3391185 RepID=UPI00398507F3